MIVFTVHTHMCTSEERLYQLAFIISQMKFTMVTLRVALLRLSCHKHGMILKRGEMGGDIFIYV